MFVYKAAVVGAGRMGSAIAQLIASAGIAVVVCDVDPAALQAALQGIRTATAEGLEALVAKQAMTREQADEELARTLARVAATTAYEGFGDVDIAIEAVPERPALKQQVFAQLDAATPGHATLASATSACSISDRGS